MSEENVEVVRTLAEGFQHRQHERAFEFYDPEIEWDASALAESMPDIGGVFHGYEGVRTYWRNWLSAWSDLQFEIQDVVDAGDEVVLLIRNQRQWGRHSGLETKFAPYGMVFTFRGGKVVGWRNFPTNNLPSKPPGCGSSGARTRCAWASVGGGTRSCWARAGRSSEHSPSRDEHLMSGRA
jgi:ketosteroid isomerase-like protein